MKSEQGKLRMRKPIACAIAVAVLAGVVSAGAQEPIVYPAKGQNDDKMEKDKYSCYSWAKKQTGFDPMQAPTASAPPPKEKGGAVKGAAGGAAVGAVAGAIGGNAGKGAAIGAATGGIIGGVRKRQSQKEQASYQQDQQSQYANRRGEYNRAWGACMEGRGYTVK
ncbi:YMGG-like glycine zipper-containing protein [Geomonas sp.]|uniref:YMGG-like glycine zipper-containing protein n=1 Tax=Geomonas sp. TaxID=2651584 RepID=UPI002B4A2FD6|nr:YMGG-like glycine zipper-containing protein [Geomonas sp.]HJV35892.1 YMGG-like glycine zipper-containing protein [Geomonas sp.]